MLEPWQTGPRDPDAPRRRFHEPRRIPWGYVSRARGLKPEPGYVRPRPSGEALFEQRFVLPVLFLTMLAIYVGVTLYAVLTMGWVDSMWWGVVGLALLPGAVGAAQLPRTLRAVRVDADGLWVSRRIAVPAGEIRAVVPMAAATAVAAQRTRDPVLSWTNIYTIDLPHDDGGVRSTTVLVPFDWDMFITHGSQTPGVLVVTGRRHGKAWVAWGITTYRRSRLVEALVAVAPRVEAADPVQGWRGNFDDEAGARRRRRDRTDTTDARR